MKNLRALVLVLGLALAACNTGPAEPDGGCLLAVGRERENLRNVERGKNYLPGSIPCRILALYWSGGHGGHAALVYRLTPGGWFVFDDLFGSRRLAVPNVAALPAPLAVARRAFPGWDISRAEWWD